MGIHSPLPLAAFTESRPMSSVYRNLTGQKAEEGAKRVFKSFGQMGEGCVPFLCRGNFKAAEANARAGVSSGTNIKTTSAVAAAGPLPLICRHVQRSGA